MNRHIRVYRVYLCALEHLKNVKYFSAGIRSDVILNLEEEQN